MGAVAVAHSRIALRGNCIVDRSQRICTFFTAVMFQCASTQIISFSALTPTIWGICLRKGERKEVKRVQVQN